MMYSTTKLKTQSECDSALAMANKLKADLLFKQTTLTRELDGQEKSVDTITATLIAVNAQLTGFAAAIAAMADGEAKKDLQSKVRRLNDQKENLEERLGKSGAPAYLGTELQAEISKKGIEEIDVLIAAIAQRKTEL